MPIRVDAFVTATKKVATAGVSALVLGAAFTALGTGIAGADVIEIDGDPSVTAHPTPEGGVRVTAPGRGNAGASEVRRSKIGAPLPPAGGQVKDSLRAVPDITGGIGTYINTGKARNGPGMAGW